MPFFDMPLEALRSYRPEIDEPADFDSFWSATLAEAQRFDLDVRITPHECHLRAVDVHDLSFRGWNGELVRAWVTVPHGATGRLPAVIQYRGYQRGRGLPFEEITYSAAGYVHVLFDARGQGWSTTSWEPSTPDNRPAGTNAGVPGMMTDGVLDPQTYYYRRLFTDAVRLVQAVRQLDLVDPDRIAVVGGSQGGGISLAAAALAPTVGAPVVACAPDVVFLCHFRRAVGLTGAYPYQEVADYLQVFPHHVDRVFETLSYFDGVSMAARVSAPVLFSLGQMDTVSPPSTVFAAYNACPASSKDIVVYPFNGHEGGQQYQIQRKVEWLRSIFGE